MVAILFVLTGIKDGKITVADCGSRQRTKQTWSLDLIVNESNGSDKCRRSVLDNIKIKRWICDILLFLCFYSNRIFFAGKIFD